MDAVDAALLRWAKGRGIVTHPGLAFYTPTATGRGVRALENVDPDELLCLVPLEACCGHELWLPETEVDPSVASLVSTLRACFGELRSDVAAGIWLGSAVSARGIFEDNS